MATREPTPKLISASELDEVLEQARVEGWQELALIGPSPSFRDPSSRLVAARTFFLKEPLGPWVVKLTSLARLTTLDLSANQIGDDGARALTNLPNLSYLYLSANQIGDDGARALANLPNLSNLHLRNNQIGDDGACALASLPNLSSL
jgi:Leucine-rich repeat (LRR) protein